MEFSNERFLFYLHLVWERERSFVIFYSIFTVDWQKNGNNSFWRELRLYLYRHWSIWESFYHSLFTMSQFKLWSLRGQRKHLDFLSSIGLSLQNCKRKFKSVDTKVRNDASVKIISTYEKHFRQGLKSNIWFRDGFAHNFVYCRIFAFEYLKVAKWSLSSQTMLQTFWSKLVINPKWTMVRFRTS